MSPSGDRCPVSYFFLLKPTSPNNPAPNSNMLAGSGTDGTDGQSNKFVQGGPASAIPVAKAAANKAKLIISNFFILPCSFPSKNNPDRSQHNSQIGP